MTQTFLISWPPSVNNLWRAVNGRTILSSRYRAWRKAAATELLLLRAKPMAGPVEITIALCPPDNRSFDIDNRAKGVLDLLCNCGVIESDNSATVKKLTVQLGEGFTGARICVEAAP